MDEEHEAAVKILQRQVGDFCVRKVPFRVYHGSTNATRVMEFKRGEMVDVSGLDRVLSVDAKHKTVLAEPNVPMDKLIDATLKYGMVPPVVTEFPGITVGGAIQGGAVESGSFEWGVFSQTVTKVEMILGNGKKISASSDEHPDLFFGAAGSYGSLGLITAAEIRLVPAKKYVAVSSFPVKSFTQALDLTEKLSESDYDFIECGMISKDCGTVLAGKYSDEIIGELLHFRRAVDPYYAMYIDEMSANKIRTTNTLPIKDYLFRYDRGAFSTAQLAFKQRGLPFNPIIRFVLNPWLNTRKLYQFVQATAAAQKYICQDIVLPAEGLPKFMDFIDAEFNLYPTGFIALKTQQDSQLLFNYSKSGKFVYNVAVYGLRVEPYEKFIDANRLIEDQTHKCGGRKWFYAHSYYTEKEFWKIYDKNWYDKLRKKYDATMLPDIYQRTRAKEHYKVDTKRAALKTVFGRAKLRITD